MTPKHFNPSEIKRILLITLSNIGDVVLTFPVLDKLIESFPEAKLSVVVGPKAASFFSKHPLLERTIVFDKRQSFLKTIQMVFDLRRHKYDMAIDLRNTAIPFLSGARYKAPVNQKFPPTLHMQQKHLKRLSSVHSETGVAPKKALFISEEDKVYIRGLLGKTDQESVVMAPGSANERKRWNARGFSEVANGLVEKYNVRVIFVGDESDRSVGEEILRLMECKAINLCGQTTLLQSAEVIRQSSLAVMNDSASMHLASYLDIPTLGLFGASDPLRYGPWSKTSCYIESPQEGDISAITPEDVLAKIEKNQSGFSFK